MSIALLIFTVHILCRSLCAVGNGCKKLTNLTLSDCYFLSDKSLEAIAQGCTGLTHLEVNGCHNIGTSGLASIGRSCPCVFVLSPLNGYISFKEMMTWIRFNRKAIVLGILLIIYPGNYFIFFS